MSIFLLTCIWEFYKPHACSFNVSLVMSWHCFLLYIFYHSFGFYHISVLLPHRLCKLTFIGMEKEMHYGFYLTYSWIFLFQVWYLDTRRLIELFLVLFHLFLSLWPFSAQLLWRSKSNGYVTIFFLFCHLSCCDWFMLHSLGCSVISIYFYE